MSLDDISLNEMQLPEYFIGYEEVILKELLAKQTRQDTFT